MITTARTAAVTSLVCLALAGCEEGQTFNFGSKKPDGESAEAPVQGQARTVLKDVERPDVFNVSDTGLWDGRPSLGGVWVAHPEVTAPERVKITNTSNGESIAGALFRRERDNPGPRFQVSADAAAGLSMLAGQPAELTVLVVRQEEIVIEAAPAPVSEETPGDDGEILAGAATVDDSGADGPATEAPTKPKRPNFFQRLFAKKPKTTAATGTALAGAAATVDIDTATPDVETSTLDPVTTGAAAAIARAESDDKPAPRPARQAEPASGLKNPYVQIGQFSVEANANAAASNLRQSGIVPTILRSGEAWRVVIGPVSTADDQAAILAQVKNLGYSDAFLTPK